MAANPRRRRRRRVYSRRRRRHNPAASIVRGLPIPDLMTVGVAAAGGIGSKMLVKQFLPQVTGWMSPLATFGAGIGIAFILKMVKMGQFARPVALGAGIVAAMDGIKIAAPQLGGLYVAPGDATPVLSGGGVGMFPEGFADPSLSAGDANFPSGFQPSYDDIY